MNKQPTSEQASDIRDGEQIAVRDPATEVGDASLVFIGCIRSPWQTRSDCPKNMREARERQPEGCSLEIDEAWRPGLNELSPGDHIHILYWMGQARRDLIRQKPRHKETSTGVFSLRSPVRPNPIALALVTITAINHQSGSIQIDATDALDKTSLLDIKPWIPAVDTINVPK
ncbi:MAG: tRNA (N6-threonylcarbamoyladenosine(37)-N6)-methyltransferase TrmO [Anderseniella sp.]